MVDNFKYSLRCTVHTAASVSTISTIYEIQIQCSREFSVRLNVWEHSTLSNSKCFFLFHLTTFHWSLIYGDKDSAKLRLRIGNVSPTIIYNQKIHLNIYNVIYPHPQSDVNNYKNKSKCKVHPKTGHEGPEGEYSSSYTLL
jgi:hypothetical protein